MISYPEGSDSSKSSQYLLSEAEEQTGCHFLTAQNTCLNGVWGSIGPSKASGISELDLLSIFIGSPLNNEDVKKSVMIQQDAVHKDSV